MKSTLLAIFAHPDDESFGTGGTLAKYAAHGTRVVLACATRGEVGEISDPALAAREALGDVREAELRTACAALGVHELRFLGYRDSGMVGTPENDDPRCYRRADPEAATRQLVALIREIRPHVIITFDPSGGYGHPDHIAVSRYTSAAFDLAGDPGEFPEAGSAWQPQRLFYNVFPRSFLIKMRDRMRALGLDTSDFDRFDAEPIGYRDEQITAAVVVSAQVDAKWAALHCHRTQFGPNNLFRRLPEAEMRAMISREYFAQARPAPVLSDVEGPANGARKPSDLFAGL